MAEPSLRAATVEDAPAIAAVCNAETQALYGEPDADAASVAGWFGLSEMAMVVAELDGRVAGYADVRSDEGGARFPIDVRVDPAAAGRGIADALLGATEEWAATRALPEAEMRAFVPDRDDEYREAVEARGYEEIRSSFTMQIELAGSIEEPAWPAGTTVRTYDPARDEQAVYECAQESFAEHWDFERVPIETWREFRASDPRFDPALWWLAEADGELAAICLNSTHFSGEPAFGWIGTLGVRREWRRRGLGRALLLHSFRDFAARGATRVGLGVDAENTTGAVRLYERAGMRVVRRHDSYSRTL